jgi:RHS repeat-associated protein
MKSNYSVFKKASQKSSFLLAILINSMVFGQPIQQSLYNKTIVSAPHKMPGASAFHRNATTVTENKRALSSKNGEIANSLLENPAATTAAIYKTNKNSASRSRKTEKPASDIINVGYNDVIERENPRDNFAYFKLPNDILNSNTQVLVTYDLYGLTTKDGVNLSINEGINFGGYNIQTDTVWKMISQKLPAYLFKTGSNEFFFNRRYNESYYYQIRNLRTEIVEFTTKTDAPIIEQAYLTESGYVGYGFAPNGITEVTINDEIFSIQDNVFEFQIDCLRDDAVIVLGYADGAGIVNSLNFPVITKLNHQFNTVRAPILKQENLRLSIKGPDSRAVEIFKITPLNFKEIKPLNSDIVNVTKGAFKAYNISRNNLKDTLQASISLEYDISLLPTGYAEKDIRTFVFSKQKKEWISIAEFHAEREAGIIVSAFQGDNDYINGIIKVPEMAETASFTPTTITDMKYADPGAQVVSVAPPSANERGTLNTSFPIKLPAARSGLVPSLNISYDSEGGNGWLGMGWNLQLPAITLDTRWGVPLYDTTFESELYQLNGTALVLQDAAGDFTNPHRSQTKIQRATNRQFYPRVEGAYQKIIRHGTNVSNYFWEVTDKSGFKTFYGGDLSGGLSENRIIRKDGATNGAITHWAICKQIDTNGNTINYIYDKDTEVPIPNTGIPSLKATSFYPKEIRYNSSDIAFSHQYQVKFIRKSQESPSSLRIDQNVSYRTGTAVIIDDLLSKIIINDPQNQASPLIRSYSLKYSNSSFQKTQLTDIEEIDKTGDLFYRNSFDYYDDVYDSSNGNTSNGLFNSTVNTDWASNTVSYNNPITSALPGAVSPLGGSSNLGFNAGMRAGFGVGKGLSKVDNTIGGSYNYSMNISKTRLNLIDINGDGLADKVFTNNNVITNTTTTFYDENSGDGFLGSSPLPGLSKLTESVSRTNSTGVDIYIGVKEFGVGAGKGWSTTKTDTDFYFNDFNGDGLMDVSQGNRAVFNTAADSYNLGFSNNPNNTKNVIFPGQINGTLINNIPLPTKEHIRADHPQFDHVSVWKAPFDGTINVTGFAGVIARNTCETPNVVRFSLERTDTNNSTTQLIARNASTAAQINMGQSAIAVNKDDLILFRVHNLEYGCGARVVWNPGVQYVGTLPAVGGIDENEKNPTNYNAVNDFLLNSAGVYTTGPEVNSISVNWKLDTPFLANLAALNLSDHVEFIIERTTTSYDIQFNETTQVVQEDIRTYNVHNNSLTAPFSQSYSTNNHFANPNTPVLARKRYDFKFKVRSNSNIKWDELHWQPVITPSGLVNNIVPPPDPFIKDVAYESYENNENQNSHIISLATIPNAIIDANDPLDPQENFIEIKNDFDASLVHIKRKLFQIYGDDPSQKEFRFNWVTKAYHVNNSTGLVQSELLRSVGFIIVKTDCSFQHSNSNCNFRILNTSGTIIFDTNNPASIFPSHLKSFFLTKEQVNQLKVDHTFIKSAFYVTLEKFGFASDIDVTINLHASQNAADYNNISNFANINRPFMSTSNDFYGPSYRSWGQFLYNGGITLNYDNDGEPTTLRQSFDNTPVAINVLRDTGNANLDAAAQQTYLDNASQGNATPRSLNYVVDIQEGRYENNEVTFLGEPNANNPNSASLNLNPGQSLGIRVGRFGEHSIYNVYVDPADLIAGTGGIPALKMRSKSKGKSTSGNITLGPQGPTPVQSDGTLSTGYSTALVQYNDLNGDRYPDLSTPSNVQFTNMLGGMEKNIDVNFHTGAENEDFTVGVSLAGISPNSTSQDNNNLSSANPTNTNGNSGLSGGNGFTKNIKQYTDMNGDGLPDQVTIYKDSITVSLNPGYRFLAAYKWININDRSVSTRFNVSLGAGSNNIPISQTSSYAFGAGASRSTANIETILMDVNGDGLPDLVQRSSNSTFYFYRLNTGTSFSNNSLLLINAAIDTDTSISYNAFGTGTFGFLFTLPFIPIPFKFTFTATLGGNYSTNDKDAVLQDINGDGYPDVLSSDRTDRNAINARLNRLGRTHLLKTVYLPMGGKWTVDYERNGNTFDMPSNKWVLKEVKTNDGFNADNAFKRNETLTTFAYENGFEHRREREFLGFEKVITRLMDPANPSTVHKYSEVTYHNKNVYLAGRVENAVTYDGNNEPISETITTHELRNAASPNAVFTTDNDTLARFNFRVFPVVTTIKAITYENSQMLSVEQSFDNYDSYGNLTQYTNYGDTQSLGAAGDGYRTNIGYAPASTSLLPYVPGRPEVITVKKLADLSLSRKREATYDAKANLTGVKVQLNASEFLETGFTYDGFGNLTSSSVNANGATYTTLLEYDPLYHIYPSKVTNPFGEESSMTYNYQFGVPITTTDVNNHVMRTIIDDRGRVVQVAAPGDPWTIHMQYENENIALQQLGPNGVVNAIGSFIAQSPSATSFAMNKKHHAVTRHKVPGANQGQLLTVSLVDGLGQPVQVKKSHYITDTSAMAWLIDGKVTYDNYGNALLSYLPTTAGSYPTNIANGTVTSAMISYDAAPSNLAPPAEMTYDVRDRVETAKMPGNNNVTTASYAINDGMLLNTTVNELGQTSKTWTDVRGRQRRSQQEDITTWFWYDHLGQKIKTNNNAGYESKYWYDMAGRRTQESHPDRGVQLYTYDILGNMTERRTSNLLVNGGTDVIIYAYDFKRLTGINYPQQPENNVTYTYGTVQTQSQSQAQNTLGRLYLQQDATGVQYFDYDDLGNLNRTLRGVAVPGQHTYWFQTKWIYDHFNRVQEITYPDDEVVQYQYNPGGKLTAIDRTLPQKPIESLISNISYNAIGERTSMEYGNGTSINYTYDGQRRIEVLTHVFDGGNKIIKNAYGFDQLSNITSIENIDPTSALPAVGEIGGAVTHNYGYDNYNRLINASGRYTGADDLSLPYLAQDYSLSMEYDTAHNITSKLQAHTQGNVTDHGVGAAMSNEQIVPKTSYKLVYEEHAQGSFTVPGQDGDVSYVQPHAPRVIKETPDAQTYDTNQPEYREQHLDYDANGNMLSIKLVVNHEDSPDVRDGVVQQQQTLLSSYIWDEENRLRAVNMNPEQPGNNQVAVYTYDAAGQRVVRHIPSRLDVRENGGARSIGDKAVNVLYPSPLVTAQAITANGKATAGEPITSYTKHYYMDATRVASTLGTVRDLGLYPMMEKSFARNLAPVIRPLANTATQTAQTALLNTYAALGQTSNASAPVIEGDLTSFNHVYGENDPRTYWYHPDHLGSSSYSTNVEGIVTQHMEYMPYGESLVEEHQNSINTPYKFNGKELDDETGNYYYGARYYNPKFSFWLSVDPLAEVTMQPYSAFNNNPVFYTDPTGMIAEPFDDHYINNDGSIRTVKTDDNFDRFFVEDGTQESGYSMAGQLDKNDAGLVQFPSSGENFSRYGTNDAGGTSGGETVGQGDHYLQPETAAALYGLVNKLNTDFGFELSLGDMSSSNGSDPWQTGFSHHKGHGHLGRRSGLDVDFRYLNTDGVSFQSPNAFKSSSFSSLNNQRVYDAAATFGFTKNFQGLSGNLTGPSKISLHNDHGHLGLQHTNLNWKYVPTAPVRQSNGLFNWLNR